MKQLKFFWIIALMPWFLAYPQDAAASPSTKAPVAKASWEDRWNATIAEAKKEGEVVVTTRLAPDVRTALAGAFKAKYGVNVQFIAGQISEIWPKVQASRRAGLYKEDVMMDGAAALVAVIRAAGDHFDSMDADLLLPEVVAPHVWRDKNIPFMDKERKVIMFLSRVGPTIVINTDLVKSDEIRSWRDLLAPKWSRKILLMEPSIAGPGNAIITTIAELMGIDFLKELAKQKPVINRDMRLQVEWVARAKHPLGLGFEFTSMEEFRKAGSPVSHVVPAEGTYFGAGTGGMSLLSKVPHPNARRLFVNWFLSKEGQTIVAKTAGEQSRRLDVTVELAPDRLFKEGVKYVDGDTAYLIDKREKMKKLTKEIFTSSTK